MGVNQFHLYKKERGLNYNYVDRVVKNHMEMGGVLIHIYPLIGAIKSDGTVVPIDSTNEMSVSDIVLNESNKRKYSHVTFDSYMTTKMNTPQFSWTFSGLSLLDGDEKQFWIHYNTMIETIGRKLICGDVLELSFIRDLDALGSNKALNRFYVITTSERDEQSYGPEYAFHVWTIKCKPITNSPEYSDLFNTGDDIDDPFYEEVGSINGGGGIYIGGDDDSMTQEDKLLQTNDEILKEAELLGPNYRLHNEHHIYLDKQNNLYIGSKPNITGIDGMPVELNCEDIPYGDCFPFNAVTDSYFLRIDYNPPALYKRVEVNGKKGWQLYNYDNREKWTGVPAVLRNIINNNNTFTNEMGEEVTMKQSVRDLVPARVSKEHNNPRPWNEEIAKEIEEKTHNKVDVIGIKKP